MTLFIIIIAGLLLAFPIYVLSQLSALRQELNELRALMKVSTRVPHEAAQKPAITTSMYGEAYTVTKASLATPPTMVTPSVAPISPTPTFAPATLAPLPPSSVERWFTEDIFMKIGAFLVLLALGWFVSYAFMNDWIGPVGRIAFGIGFGVLLMLGGVWRTTKDVMQGVVFLALGMSTVLLSIYAARFAYDFFTPGTALVLMFITIAVTAGLSVRLQSVGLGAVALVGGALAPLLAHTASPDVFGLHVYLGVLFAGTLFVSALLRSPGLVLGAFSVAVMYGLPYLTASDLDLSVARLAAFFFGMIFLLFGTVTLMSTKTPDYQIYLITCLGVALYFALWLTSTVPAVYQGTVALALAGAFLFFGALLWQAYTDKSPAYVHMGVGIAYIALATAYYLDGDALLMAYLAQITVVVCIALFVIKDLSTARAFSWLYGGVVFMSLPYFISNAWDTGILHTESLMLVTIATVLVGVGVSLARAGDDTNTDAALITVGALYYLVLFWIATHTMLGDQLGTAVSLVTFTIIGLALYFGGQRTNDEYARLFGACMVGGVVLRLLIVDVWDLELIFRIIAFFVVGVLLLSTAFYNKKQLKEVSLPDNN